MPAFTAGRFRYAFLIYCLIRLKDGCYIAVNRQYKPLGVMGGEWVEYETHPSRFKFKRALSGKQVAALSCHMDTSAERIQLYGGDCDPIASHAEWQAYSARLQRLAGYKVVAVHELASEVSALADALATKNTPD